jgi:hypothetical protein
MTTVFGNSANFDLMIADLPVPRGPRRRIEEFLFIKINGLNAREIISNIYPLNVTYKVSII